MEFGNEIHEILVSQKVKLFDLGQRVDLTYRAFSLFKNKVQETNDATIITTVPFGLDEKGELIEEDRIFTKDELLNTIDTECIPFLPIEGISKLTSIVEMFFIDCCYKILNKFPQKIASKNKVDTSLILSSENIEDLKEYVIKRYLNEITYQSPQDFVREFLHITGVNLNDFELYPHYVELKASRDIHIHNNGIINSIYLTKAGELARGKDGESLDISFQYFFLNYELCFRLFEYLDSAFHKIWYSTIYQQIIDSFNNKAD